MGSYKFRFCFPLLCLFFSVTAAYAQVTSVSGKVTDAAGAVIPGVTVTLRSSTAVDYSVIDAGWEFAYF